MSEIQFSILFLMISVCHLITYILCFNKVRKLQGALAAAEAATPTFVVVLKPREVEGDGAQ